MPAPIDSLAVAARRLGCTPAEAIALGILAVAAVAVAGLLWVLGRPVSVAPVGGAVPPTEVASGGVVVTDVEVIVHVAGAVSTPGVYRLPGGSRVADAVDAAGGARRNAALEGLNLARVLTDGEQVFVADRTTVQASAGVGSAGAAATPGGAAPGAVSTVSLNSATVADLETLPGIGPVLAQAIVDYRDSVGGFKDVSELRDVSGIGEKTFQALAPLVSL